MNPCLKRPLSLPKEILSLSHIESFGYRGFDCFSCLVDRINCCLSFSFNLLRGNLCLLGKAPGSLMNPCLKRPLSLHKKRLSARHIELFGYRGFDCFSCLVDLLQRRCPSNLFHLSFCLLSKGFGSSKIPSCKRHLGLSKQTLRLSHIEPFGAPGFDYPSCYGDLFSRSFSIPFNLFCRSLCLLSKGFGTSKIACCECPLGLHKKSLRRSHIEFFSCPGFDCPSCCSDLFNCYFSIRFNPFRRSFCLPGKTYGFFIIPHCESPLSPRK